MSSDCRLLLGNTETEGDGHEIAIVGTGGRATSYIDPLVNEYHADHELVALCDPNPHRINYHRDRFKFPF
ncbi:MAG: hypothetical protein CM1200mP3_01590 [Chloroflexota bacterium]|nr:MAG: hypothetical protein CM1200mP3_01590 [Chloroflexota bacterium]